MPWECGECRAVEGGKQGGVIIEVMCHHCGKPLCQKHRILIVDEAFDPAASSASLRERLLGLLSPGLAPVPAAAAAPGPVNREAYHCEACKNTHHPRAPVVEARATP